MYEELQVEDQLVYARVYTQMILWSIKKGNESKAE
jgi:hypothetical protein